MVRDNRFVILLTEGERQVIEALARTEKLAASTLARRYLLFEAEQRGIGQAQEMKNGSDDRQVNLTAVL